MKIHLDGRLQAALSLVQRAECLADVGCDHGKLVVAALLEGVAARAVAVDVSAPSLAKAERLAADCGVSLDCLLGDGLSPTVGYGVDVAVIAGMGGMETARILALAPYSPPRLVLVPHKNTDTVMRYLHAAGYRIARDYYLEDGGHWYRAIAAESVSAKPLGAEWRQTVDALPDDANWYVGEDNRRLPDYPRYRRERIDKLRSLVAKGNKDAKVSAEIRYLESMESL